MVMTGLFKEDSHVYYVDNDYVVVNNPYDNDNPTLVKRKGGDPDDIRVRKLLHTVGMKLDGQPFYREDGLWCSRLKMNGAKYA